MNNLLSLLLRNLLIPQLSDDKNLKVDIHPICPFLIYFFLQPIGNYRLLNIIVSLAKIVKDSGTAKNLMKNMVIWQNAKIWHIDELSK